MATFDLDLSPKILSNNGKEGAFARKVMIERRMEALTFCSVKIKLTVEGEAKKNLTKIRSECKSAVTRTKNAHR